MLKGGLIIILLFSSICIFRSILSLEILRLMDHRLMGPRLMDPRMIDPRIDGSLFCYTKILYTLYIFYNQFKAHRGGG